MAVGELRDVSSRGADSHPLSSPQLDIYHDQLMKAGAPTYNIGGYLDLAGALDITVFDEAWKLVVRKHDSLRIELVDEGRDVPVQRISQEIANRVPFLDVSTHASPHDDALARMREIINEPFALIGKPLYRSLLIKLDDQRFYWFICAHHLIADGWAMDTVFHSFAELYSELERNETPTLDAPSYLGFVASDDDYLHSRQFDKDKDYWLEKYNDVPAPLLSPRYQEQFADQLSATGECSWPLTPELDEAIDSLASNHGSTRFQIVLGLFYAFYLRLEQRDELTIGMSVLNRKDAASRKTVGMFTNVVPMRLRFDREGSFLDLLKAIAPSLRQDYRHQRFPIGELYKRLDLFKSHRSQVYDLSISYENGGGALHFGQTPAVVVKSTNDYEGTPLRFCVRDDLERKASTMFFIFGRAYFNDSEIESLRDHFVGFMEALLSKPDAPIASLLIVTNHEVRQFAAWNATDVDFDDSACTHAVFERHAAERPDAIALVHRGTCLTYGELNAEANRLAHHLIALGVRPDDRVALCVERGISMVVGLLAILKAGGGYVPIDPVYASERLAYVLDDAQPCLVLADAAGRRALGPAATAFATCNLDDTLPPWASLPTHDPQLSDLASNHLAYVIYTSGSTGQPKGVMVEHRHVVHQVVALQRAYGLTAADRLLQFASMAFDMSVEEIFPALLTGATLVMRTDECLGSLAAFATFCTEHGLTSLNLPSTFFAQLAMAEPEIDLPPTLRQVSAGGDAMSLPAVAAWLARTGHRPRLFNAYGPTEATVNATLLEVDRVLQLSSIGRPVSNARTHVLDSHAQPVPIGTVGELYIGGAGVARGYLGRPELTTERFLPDPFSSRTGDRMYRTGDLARYLTDGEIEFLGRNDNQVKIRGYRIEPGEIETRLVAHPTIRDAVVVALGDGQEKRLVAYVTTHADGDDVSSQAGAWRAHLAACLPDYMVPAAFVRLDALPLTANGKLDRKALPDPDDRAFARQSYEAPRGEVEVALAALWEDLLGVERIGRQDHFFELGGHSLVAIRLLGRVGQVFDSALPLASLFNHPTLSGLATAIEAGRKDNARPALPSIHAITRGPTLPLSHAQQRLWFMAQLDNDTAIYHVALVVQLEGDLDSDLLQRSLDSVLDRHEALRTVFRAEDGDPHAVLLPRGTRFPFVAYDVRESSDADARLARHAHDYAHAPFDLEQGPLVRAGLVRLSERRYTLLLSMHHIVSDGWSLHLLANEISALYTAFAQHFPDPLPPLAVQYPDYAGWQRATLTSERLRGQATYWQRTLDGAPALLDLPTDRPRPARQSFAGAIVPVHLDSALTRRLKQRCTQHGVSLFMLLTAAWAAVLSRLTGQDDVLIGTLSANRGQREIEPLIGFFVSTLALRLDVSGEPDVPALLSRVRDTVLAAQENQDLPFEQVVEIARPSRRLDHSPLFQVLFAWQSNDRSRFELPGVEVHQADMSLDAIRYDLELHLYEKDEAVVGGLGYAKALFDEATVARHVGYLTTMLEAMTDDAKLPLHTVCLPGADERAMLEQWNDTAQQYPHHDGIHRLFEEHAARSPQAVALVHGEQHMSYAQLNAQANQWARQLRSLGIGEDGQVDQRVALCAERGFDMVAALLAILKAGACYVPLDPSYPAERLRQVLDEAGATLVLGDDVGRDALGESWPDGQQVLDLGKLGVQSTDRPKDDLVSLAHDTADRLAYVIYTSGSTGTPKGVAMPHAPLINLIHWQRSESARAGVPAPRTLQFAALGFDVAFQEIFATLCAGASLVLIDAQTRLQFGALVEVLREQRVQRVFLPYIALQALAEAIDEAPGGHVNLLPDLCDVIVAGEQLRLTPQIQRLFQRLPACRLHNHYGPTETHVVTAQTLVPEMIGDTPSHVPIGRPIAHARAYLLDRHGLPVPLGAAGELHIGGAVVARGYLGRDELTTERFLPDPFDARPGARMYRTGDLARHLPDGRLVFLGRNDQQVKVRGFRIEPGEIEANLATHPGVRECAVIARTDVHGETQLIAYVVASGDAGDMASSLHAHASAALPAYMVPAAFVSLAALPLTAHGKLDRNALPSPDEEAFARSRYELPQGDAEAKLAALWQTLLGVTRVGRNDHFFDLGGHSLIAVRLLSRITQAFGVVLPLSTLFARPVLHDLAMALVDASPRTGSDPHGTMPVIPRTGKLPLSHAQQRLWFLSQLDGDGATYHIPLAVRLEGALDVDALRTALNDVFARHESLRTVIVAEHGQPHAEVLPSDIGLSLHEADLSAQHDIDTACRRLLADERNRPFPLATGPLVRAVLLRLGADEYALQLTLHHIVADGWSLGILARELSARYAVATGRGGDPLPVLPIQYADYAAWERRWATGEHLLEQAAYWRQQLDGAPTLLELPTDRPRPERQSFEGAFFPFALDRDTTRELRKLGQKHGATLFMTVLAAWAVVLSRLSGQREVLIGTPTAGRGRQELESLIGFFINTLALRVDLSTPLDTASLLAQVRQIALDAQSHQDLPFEQVVDLAQMPRRTDHTPLVQVLLAWQSHDEGALAFPGVVAEPMPAFDWVKFDLELILSEVDGTIQGGFNYATALFDAETIKRHAGYLQTVLDAMVADAFRAVDDIPLLSAGEHQQLLGEWNRTTRSYPDAMCMHGLVERWARERPEAIALVGEHDQLSYRELNAQANRLAHHLIGAGVRPGQRIALCVEKGLPMFVGLLGIMKAGAAYVPLDPAYASGRLDHILRDAAPSILVCDGAGRGALGTDALATVPVLDLTEVRRWADEPAIDPDVPDLDAHHLAYLIYTSGSTGTPKGVMVEHHAVINLALSLSDRLGVTADSRVSQFASLGFDASIFESAMTLAVGGTLYLPSASERQSPPAFLAFIGRHRITHATLPPAFLQGHPGVPAWTHRPMLILVGEASSPGLVKMWSRHARMANAYGPTEITVCASVWLSPDDAGDVSVVPIGRPLANTRLYVLDSHGLPLPRGTIGELYIGGTGVARGYLERPELTAQRFLPDPFDHRPHARMYRSGDLVRYLPDGNLVFVGRNDHQVKLRGFRIELGDIETQLSMHPLVHDNVVLVREDRPGDPRLVAYVVAPDIGDDEIGALRDHLATKLPEYMVPAAFVLLDQLPLTAHGKLDRQALPPPDDQAYARRVFAPPRGDTETALAALWRELLGIDVIGRQDHFFELGGHSLLVTQLASRAQDVFGKALPIRDVFRHPVLKDMAKQLSPGTGAGLSPVMDLRAELVLDASIRANEPARHGTRPAHILLTGASGFLGAFLLASLLKRTDATVHCLVRCANVQDGQLRLDANMQGLGLGHYDRTRVRVIPGDLASPKLGLDDGTFERLAECIDVIHHNGAWVNSLHTYESLKAANVVGTQEILRLASTGIPKHVHYVSTLSTIPPVESAGAEITNEAQLAEYWPGLASGYAQSKWVAERLLRIGGDRGIPFTIYRPTHVGGASDSGASNATDTWSLFVDACLTLERIPDADTDINSLPVDVMADSIVSLSLREDMHGKSLNLLHPQSFMLSRLTRQIAAIDELSVERIDYRQWHKLCGEHAATRRLASVMPAELSADAEVHATPSRIVITNVIEELSREGMRCPPISDAFLRKYVEWRYRSCGLLA